MRTVGIIAEYNPFHTGHQYHIEQAKEQAAADFAVVVMSPDFVQRGEPAIFGKYERAEMALRSGADLVLELPVCYATGSAEYFAKGAVALLDRLQIVDVLCFGSETADRERFLQTAAVLEEEPEPFQTSLRELLKAGKTFPEARAEALDSCLSGLHSLLATPNNILGTEYCRALLCLHSRIQPLPIRRMGNAYDSTALETTFSSATALRARLCGSTELPESQSAQKLLLPYIPKNCRPLFDELCGRPVTANLFLPYLTQKLLSERRFDRILDVSPDLADRIDALRYRCIGRSWEELTALLKTRQFTQARIRRCLLHLMLDITKQDLADFRASGSVFYAHVLGFRKSAGPLLHAIKEVSLLPLLTKMSAAPSVLEARYGTSAPSGPIKKEASLRMLRQDQYASHLYRAVCAQQYAQKFRTEYECSPVILS